jgi:hypothetical protein
VHVTAPKQESQVKVKLHRYHQQTNTYRHQAAVRRSCI